MKLEPVKLLPKVNVISYFPPSGQDRVVQWAHAISKVVEVIEQPERSKHVSDTCRHAGVHERVEESGQTHLD